MSRGRWRRPTLKGQVEALHQELARRDTAPARDVRRQLRPLVYGEVALCSRNVETVAQWCREWALDHAGAYRLTRREAYRAAAREYAACAERLFALVAESRARRAPPAAAEGRPPDGRMCYAGRGHRLTRGTERPVWQPASTR